jgi:site-specific DNA-adenine methylase
VIKLRSFFPYYGAKKAAVNRYPLPKFDHIVEPFAGSASYSVNYHFLNISLNDSYDVISDIWDYLVHCDPMEVANTKADILHHISEVGEVPKPLRDLIGFYLNWSCAYPGNVLTAGQKQERARGQENVGWSLRQRNKVASQVKHIRHWKVRRGEYWELPNPRATWFIDPPYNNKAGTHYRHHDIDYDHLAHWAKTRKGQVIVCEQEGAKWLPFWKLGSWKSVSKKKGGGVGFTNEVIWTNDAEYKYEKQIFQGISI